MRENWSLTPEEHIPVSGEPAAGRWLQLGETHGRDDRKKSVPESVWPQSRFVYSYCDGMKGLESAAQETGESLEEGRLRVGIPAKEFLGPRSNQSSRKKAGLGAFRHT